MPNTKSLLAQWHETDGETLAKFAWPGGYPIFYLMDDSETVCPDCINDPTNPIHDDEPNDGWRIVARDVNYEDDFMFCAHCNKQIESAYGEPIEKNERK